MSAMLKLLVRTHPNFLSHQALSDSLWGSDYSLFDW